MDSMSRTSITRLNIKRIQKAFCERRHENNMFQPSFPAIGMSNLRLNGHAAQDCAPGSTVLASCPKMTGIVLALSSMSRRTFPVDASWHEMRVFLAKGERSKMYGRPSSESEISLKDAARGDTWPISANLVVSFGPETCGADPPTRSTRRLWPLKALGLPRAKRHASLQAKRATGRE
jgi:hypothetical protein